MADQKPNKDLQLDPRVSEGLAGQVTKDAAFIPHSTITFPLGNVESDELRDIEDDRSMRSVETFLPCNSLHIKHSLTQTK